MSVDRRRGCALVLLSLGLSVWGQQDPGRPTRLAIEPNAILHEGQPLEIEAEGIRPGDRAFIRVVEDCGGNGRPEENPSCPPIFSTESEPADPRGIARHRLDFAELDTIFPRGETLWLRAARPGSAQFRQAMFGFASNECSLFKTVIDAFLDGDCDPGLPQVLRKHRQPSDLVNAVFEVRTLAVEAASAEPVAVHRTRGASGVAWLDNETLLVTAAGVADGEGLAPGLYRVPLSSDAASRGLWHPESGEPGAVAPLALPGGRVAFVRQAPGPQRAGAGKHVAWLVILRLEDGAIELQVPLSYKIHQLLAANDGGTAVLALSLGVADNQPVMLTVNLVDESAEPEVVGFSNALYQSAMREPGGARAVVAFENNLPGRGWQLILADGAKPVRDLVKRDGMHDLAPAWRSEGSGLVYLAQVE